MNTLRRLLLAGLPLAAVAAVAVWYFQGKGDADVAQPVTATVSVGDIEDVVSALGSLQPLNYVDVGTQVSGQLQKILVDFGAEVKKGGLLAQIDPTVYEARVHADEAQLLSLKAQVAEKQAQQTLAQQQLTRQKALLAARATSQDLYDSAVANLQVIVAQIDALNAQIQQTESNLHADQANLGYTKIYAPMDGTVVDITARQGQTLNANQQAPIILRIADLNTMTVRTQVSEADVSRLRLGMQAYFTTLGEPDRKRFGKLRQILPTPEVVNNVVLYDALFDVDNADRGLLPQMSAQVFFVIQSATKVPVIPIGALIAAPGGKGERHYSVRVFSENGIERRPVEVGVTNRTQAEIKSGLKDGEKVVIGTAASAAQSGGQRASGRGFPRL